MSKAKKIISTLLAIIVLVGVGFGAYFIFFNTNKSGKVLDQKRAIVLIDEAVDKVDNTIVTIGRGAAGSSQSNLLQNGVMSNNSLLAESTIETDLLSPLRDYLHNIVRMNAFLAAGNYMLNNTGNDMKFEFGKTYWGPFVDSELNEAFITLYYEDDRVVIQFGTSEITSGAILIEYDKDKDEPASFNYVSFDIEDDTKHGSYYSYVEMSSINFKKETFNHYYLDMDVKTKVKSDEVKSKLSKGELVYNDIKDYTDINLQMYTGNIASNIDDIDFVSHTTTREIEAFFNTYRGNIKGLEILDRQLNTVNVENSVAALREINVHASATLNKYAFEVANNKFYFQAVEDYKQFDQDNITKIKTFFDTYTYDEASDWQWHGDVRIDEYEHAYPKFSAEIYSEYKEVVDALYEYYQSHKDDENYMPILLGRCYDGLQLRSVNTTVSYSSTFGPISDNNLDANFLYNCLEFNGDSKYICFKY